MPHSSPVLGIDAFGLCLEGKLNLLPETFFGVSQTGDPDGHLMQLPRRGLESETQTEKIGDLCVWPAYIEAWCLCYQRLVAALQALV